MLRATLKGLLAHKLRLGLSAVAVLLGVAFVAGTLIFTDTLGKAFRDLTNATAADITVTQRTSFDSTFGPPGTTAVTSVPEEVRAAVATVDGVEAADGDLTVNGVQLIGRDGKVVGSAGGAPGVGTNWYVSEGSPLSLEEGRAPERAGEITVERGTAEKAGVAVGDSVRVLLPQGQPVEARVVGIMNFEGNLLGATLVAFNTATAQDLLLEPGRWTSVVVTADDGLDPTRLRERVTAALPGDYTAKTAEEVAAEAQVGLADFLTFINVFLLVFAGIALFVGSFIILNTFSMLVAQRTRELALLRALGARRAQVVRSVLLEAAVVGLVGSALGLAAGVLLAYGLEALFGAFGLEIGSGPLLVDTGTILTSLVLGTVVTVVAALGPAVRASRVAPVAAMRDDVAMAPKGLRLRGGLGALLTVGGAVLLAVGLLADGAASGIAVGVGVLLVLVGAAVLAPVLTRPVIGSLAVAYPRLFGAVGRLGRDNAQRNPRRTAATASALMIGLALVGAIGTLAASTNASIDRVVDRALGADFVVSNATNTPFSTEVTAGIRSAPGVATVSPVRFGRVQIDGDDEFPLAIDPATIDEVVAIDYVSGSTDAVADDGLLVDASTAPAGLAGG
ncbi:MAG: ABC transporter permease [Actinomycetota bacterium]|nr:ABC transporter permease [Actinomycetota bacterium]